MSGQDLFGPNQSLNNEYMEASSQSEYESSDYNGSKFLYNLLTDDCFFKVIHMTQGLPFVFQADSTSSHIDSFSICKIVGNFKYKQISNAFYRCGLKIREVW